VSLTDATSVLALGDPADFNATIAGLVPGSTLDLTTIAPSTIASVTIDTSNSTIVVDETGGAQLTFSYSGDLSGYQFAAPVTDNNGGTDLVLQTVQPVDNWTGDASNGEWSSAGNWDSGIPGASDEVNIVSGVVTFDSSASQDTIYSLITAADTTLDITGGSLTIAGTGSDIFGALNLSGGQLDIAGTATAASLTFEGGMLSGAGTLTITDSLAWNAASTMYATTDVANGATATITNTVYLDGTSTATSRLDRLTRPNHLETKASFRSMLTAP
jgi:hypothetical protein